MGVILRGILPVPQAANDLKAFKTPRHAPSYSCHHSKARRTGPAVKLIAAQRSRVVRCYALAGPLELIATNTLARDTAVTVGSIIAGTIITRLFSLITAAGVKQSVSRKLVHIAVGIINMLSWPLWSKAPYARYFAALVPGFYILRMLLVGTGAITQTAFVNSITRDGRRQEVMRGPLLYTLMLMCGIVAYWRNGPIGMSAVAIMSGGDGAADLIGRRFGKTKLPWNKQKTWAGSIAMFLCGWGLSVAFLAYFHALGYFLCSVSDMVPSLAIIAGVAAVVESLPINQIVDDNVYVPLTAAFLGHCLFSRTLILV